LQCSVCHALFVYLYFTMLLTFHKLSGWFTSKFSHICKTNSYCIFWCHKYSHSPSMPWQSNLSTTTTLETPQKWPLYRGGRSLEVFQSKSVLKFVWPDLVWPLLTLGRCWQLAVVQRWPLTHVRLCQRET